MCIDKKFCIIYFRFLTDDRMDTEEQLSPRSPVTPPLPQSPGSPRWMQHCTMEFFEMCASLIATLARWNSHKVMKGRREEGTRTRKRRKAQKKPKEGNNTGIYIPEISKWELQKKNWFGMIPPPPPKKKKEQSSLVAEQQANFYALL